MIRGISIIMILVFLPGCQKKKDTRVTPQRAVNLPVEIYIVKSAPLENIIKIPGTIIPNEQTEIRTELSGRIEGLNFTEGTHVKKGTLLVRVDDTELRSQLQKLQAQYDQASSDERRKKQLLEMNGISQDEYDLAFTRLRELDADIDLIKTRINKSSIEAPFDGTIGLRMASMGAYVSPGDIITTLVQLNPVKIEFNVPEKYATFIKKGQIVNFQLSGGEKVYQGTIYATDPFIDPSIRALKVRALAENQENSLVPGAFVELTLELERINNALLIPTTAIVPLMNSQNVFVLKNGLATSTEIKTGIRKERLIQVTEGVTVGDSIAVTGLLSLRNGMPVTVSKIIQE